MFPSRSSEFSLFLQQCIDAKFGPGLRQIFSGICAKLYNSSLSSLKRICQQLYNTLCTPHSYAAQLQHTLGTSTNLGCSLVRCACAALRRPVGDETDEKRETLERDSCCQTQCLWTEPLQKKMAQPVKVCVVKRRDLLTQ